MIRGAENVGLSALTVPARPGGRVTAAGGPEVRTERGRRFPGSARLSLPVRSDPPDESGGSYESEANVRSAAADESVAAYESECEPEGLYGALKMVPGGPYGAEKLNIEVLDLQRVLLDV